jgi:hypothetical protein
MPRPQITWRTDRYARGELVPPPPPSLPAPLAESFEVARAVLADMRERPRAQDVRASLLALAEAARAASTPHALRALAEALTRLDEHSAGALAAVAWGRFRALPHALDAPRLAHAASEASALVAARAQPGRMPSLQAVYVAVARAVELAPPGKRRAWVADLLLALGLPLAADPDSRARELARWIARARRASAEAAPAAQPAHRAKRPPRR